ncbi:MAG: metallophosphoesterase [Syntrophotaleaceae bacterium]
MVLFLLTFLTLYASMHALVFWGIYPLLTGHRALPTLVGVWMGMMILAPVMVRLLDRNGYILSARGLAWIGYSWMGMLFLAFSVLALVGVWHLIALALRGMQPGWPLLSPYGPAFSCLLLLVVPAAGIYGFFEATDLRVEKVVIHTEKLPASAEPLRVAQVSDVHLGLIHREETLAPIITRLQELKPDLLVSTGDMVDAQMDHLDGLHDLWLRIDPPLGKFAVTGNHEYYAGLDQAIAFKEKSGFRVLRGNAITIGNRLTLAGIDDPTGKSAADEIEVLKKADSSLFTILLKHRPRFEEKSAGLFDLQLSGHAHRGQIFPFNFLTGLEYPMQNGLYELTEGSRLYASRGTATWGPPMRIGSPPEITLFEIVGTGKRTRKTESREKD